MLRILSNILWVLFGGIWLTLLWGICGVMLCITVIGIPFGIQCFKLAVFSFLPHGKKVVLDFKAHPVANTLWAILGGWEMAIAHLIFGVACCLTIIGISKGIQCFKITKLAFFPFGATVQK